MVIPHKRQSSGSNLLLRPQTDNRHEIGWQLDAQGFLPQRASSSF
jgi:hypothetical protein